MTAPADGLHYEAAHVMLLLQLTMEERLHAISLDKSDTRGGATAPPTAESVVHLLTQALQSKDKKLLSVSCLPRLNTPQAPSQCVAITRILKFAF